MKIGKKKLKQIIREYYGVKKVKIICDESGFNQIKIKNKKYKGNDNYQNIKAESQQNYFNS